MDTPGFLSTYSQASIHTVILKKQTTLRGTRTLLLPSWVRRPAAPKWSPTDGKWWAISGLQTPQWKAVEWYTTHTHDRHTDAPRETTRLLVGTVADEFLETPEVRAPSELQCYLHLQPGTWLRLQTFSRPRLSSLILKNKVNEAKVLSESPTLLTSRRTSNIT